MKHAPDRADHGDHWRTDAACRREDPDLFFPDGTTGRHLIQMEAAKQVCYRCPVMEQCARWALAAREEHGVWGGFSEDERRTILRRRGRGTGRPRKGA